MSERVPMVCENCGRDLWIRLGNLGRIGKCKYCGFLFRARLEEVFDLEPTPLSRVAQAADEGRGARADSPAASRQERAREPRVPLPQDHGTGISERFEPAPAPAPAPALMAAPDRSPPSERRREAAYSPISEFRAELDALRDRATQVDQLKQRLQTELAEIEQIRTQIEEAHSHTSDLEARAGLEWEQEVEALRGECHRFQEEIQALRSQMEAQSADEKVRSENLVGEYEAACAERQRLTAELETQAREVERTRNLFGAEREALVREAEELQYRLEGLERAQDDTEYEHHQARAAWVEERQSLEAWSERQRQELVEAEQRAAAQQAQFEAEQRAWDQQRDELARRIADDESRLLEAEQLQEQTAGDRDARIREGEQLAEQCAALERSRVAAEADWAAARTRWGADRDGLQAGAERQRRELIEDAARRLGELQAQLEAERRAWDQQRDALARRVADDEARLLEAEQLQGRTAGDRDARIQQVERLTEQLAAMERSRAEAEAEWAAASARWEGERGELQAQGERRRRELIDEAERRLGELQAQFEAERQAWDQQRDEHEQLAAIWESLAQEVEQVQAGLVADRDALARKVEGLRVQLGDAENSRAETEAQFHGARAAWEAERQARDQRHDELERQLAADALRLQEAEQLQGQTGRDRDAQARQVEQLTERLAALERSRAEAEAEGAEAGARWEGERGELQAQGERRRRELIDEAERRLGELQAQFEAERQAAVPWADTGPEAESLGQETEGVRNLLDASRREREAALQQVEVAIRERDLLRMRAEEAEAARREAERRADAETERLVKELEQARREAVAAAQLGTEHAEAAGTLRAVIERQRTDRLAHDEDKERSMAALRRDWEIERRRWLALLAAASPESLPGEPADGSNRPSPSLRSATRGASSHRSPVAIPQDGPNLGPVGPISSASRRRSDPGRPPRRDGTATPLRARPQGNSYHDPESFRSGLESWLAEAQASLQGLNASPGRSRNHASVPWLEFEIRTAREEIALLEQSQATHP